MEMNNEKIEWKMIRPDGSQRILHIGKNEVNSKELDFLSNNSLILFEIYFSPHFKAYLRFYGYAPLRLNFKKTEENTKHIYIDNNQSFVFLEQLENTTIDVYDKEEFVTFSFQKNIKKPENSKEIIEKKERIKWLNDNIEYEDLKKEENEYGSKSLYSRDYFNYSKKNLKKDEEQNDKSNDLMSNFSKNKSNDNIKSEEKIEENINKEKDKEKGFSLKSEESNDEEDSAVNLDDTMNKNKNKSKAMKTEEFEKENKSSNKKSSSSLYEKIEEEKQKQKKNFENNLQLDKKFKSITSEHSPLSKKGKGFSDEKKEKDKGNKDTNYLLDYDKILDDFVLLNSESESKEESSDNEEEEEEFSEKSENSAIKKLKNLQLKKENSFTKKDKLNTSLTTKCTICLDQMVNPATLKPCGHQFCKDCISKWLKKSSACPDCKKNAKKLYFLSSKNGKYMGKKIKRKKYKAEKQNYEDWFLNCDKTCLICGKEDNTAYLLVCDSCNFRICHTFCVGLDSIPDTEWHCPECVAKEQGKKFSLSKNNIKKFIEKEKKILKVKQSEVKTNLNDKKEKKEKEEKNEKINKRKRSINKNKEKEIKPEITVRSLRNRNNNIIVDNINNKKIILKNKKDKEKRKINKALNNKNFNNNKKRKYLKKSEIKRVKKESEKEEEVEEELEDEEEEEEEEEEEQEEEAEEEEEEEVREEEEEEEEKEEEESEEEEEKEEKQKQKKRKANVKKYIIQKRKVDKRNFNKNNKLLQKKTNRKTTKEKPKIYKTKQVNKNTNKIKKRKYSYTKNNINIINLRSRDKNNDSIEQRILSRRKGSNDSADLIITKNRKKSKELYRKNNKG